MNSTALTYIGKVDIKIGRKTYSNYNSGYEKLFELFARFLAGETIDPLALPNYIKVKRRALGTEDAENVIYTPMIAVKQAKVVNAQWVTIISTVLTDSNLISDSIKNTYQYDLILCAHDINTELAAIEISHDTLNQILTGRQALIEWSLYITNKGEYIK